MKYLACSVCAFVVGVGCYAQDAVPGTSPWTPIGTIPMDRVAITVPAKYQAIALNPVTHAIDVPAGWTARVYSAGNAFDKPRMLSWGPDSVLYVANMNRGNILAMPDLNRDGVADTVIVAASGFVNGHDVRFHRDTMYVSQTAGIVKLWRSSGSGYVYDQRQTIIDKTKQLNQMGGNHETRTLVIDSVNGRLFVNVGSAGNADREMEPGRERALIEVYDMDGTNRRIYATGIRNAVGMTLHPRTFRLWANNNGSDKQGNNVPGEWIDLVREGGFYGYPYAYHFRQYFDFTKDDYRDLLPITAADSALVNEKMLPPAGLVTAHSAPMAMQFSHAGMPAEFQNGAFIVLRGSWNRQPATGSKLVFLSFDNDNDTVANAVYDICRGFLPDSNDASTRWARPVGLALSADGAIFITSDDLKEFILKLTPPVASGVENDGVNGAFQLAPNPANSHCTLRWEAAVLSEVWIRDVTGYEVFVGSGNGGLTIDTSTLSSGVYVVTVKRGNTLQSMTMSIIH